MHLSLYLNFSLAHPEGDYLSDTLTKSHTVFHRAKKRQFYPTHSNLFKSFKIFVEFYYSLMP
jgi:hypothetical protein